MSLQDLCMRVFVFCGLLNCLALTAVVVYAAGRAIMKKSHRPEDDLP